MSIKPFRLKQGDRIGVLSPAGPVGSEELLPGIKAVESLNFSVALSPHALSEEGYLAGGDDLRLHDLHAMFQDERVKAIFCARGGYGVLRLFEKIDFDLIRRHPKILVGYSDITALLLAVYKKTRLVTIHGPILKEMAKNRGENLKFLMRLLTSREPAVLRFKGARALRKGSAEGRLIGGNLSLLTHLTGTPFMPSPKGAILFIEEKGESLYRIDRMLTHLRLSGFLTRCKGLMIGAFEDCGEPAAVEALIEERLYNLSVPIMLGLPVGHGEENMALPIGVKATFDTARGTLSLSEPCVR
ncbi:MAG: LD-carboxypeptidase [Deltaproteobacteria bacterium]|nr:LD-carboxypeptidase [Deltaproteobacteria bacterium]